MFRVKPPTFPVRHNKSTTQRAFSQMNGDNLPLLKKMRSSEIMPQVKGKNKSEWRAMLRNLNQKFTEKQLVLNTVQRQQDAALIDLKRLHLERRQLRRAMMEWHREEARVEFERSKEALRLEAERNRIYKEIRSLNEENESSVRPKLTKLELQRNHYAQISSKVDNHQKRRLPVKRHDLVPLDHKITGQIDTKEDHTINGPLSNGEIDINKKVMTQWLNPEVVESSAMTKSISPQLVETKSQVLEVSKSSMKRGSMEPSVHVRMGTFIDEKNMSFDAFLQTAERHIGNANDSIISSAIELVSHVNTARLNQKPRVSVIFEDSAWIKKKLQMKLLPPLAKSYEEQDLDLKQSESPNLNVSVDSLKPKCNVGENLKRKLRQQERQRKILAEPFDHFRRDAHGEFHPLGNPPPPLKIEEPSMKSFYHRKHQLLEARQLFSQSIQDLRKQTAKMIDEDITARADFEQAKIDVGNSLEKSLSEQSYDIGPAAWMKAFINDVLPDNIDPMSFEAMQHCRYLRNMDDNQVVSLTLRTPSPLPTVN